MSDETLAAAPQVPEKERRVEDELAQATKRLHDAEAELEAARARIAQLEQGEADHQNGQETDDAAGIGSSKGDDAAPGFSDAGAPIDGAVEAASPGQAWEPPTQQWPPPPQGVPQQPYSAPFAAPPSAERQPSGGQYYAPPQPPYGQHLYGQAPYAPPRQPYASVPYAPPIVTKDHVAAGLLAIFLGVFGVHKFYLGYNTAGFIMLAITILGSIFTIGLAAGAMLVISLIEGIIYLTKSQSEFDASYVVGKKEWF